MAVQKIEYPNKVRGDLFTTANATEVKQVVNHNADELTNLAQQVTSSNQAVTNLSQVVTTLREEVKIVAAQQTETTVAIDPNKLYVWGSVAELTITFNAGVSGFVNEYMLQFTPSTDSFTLSLPNGVRWMEQPDWKAGSTYYVSILNNLAVCAGWEAQS